MILQEELSGRVGLASEFRDPRVDVDVHIRVLVQIGPDRREVFGIITEVSVDERRLWMTSNDAITIAKAAFCLVETMSRIPLATVEVMNVS